MKYVKVYALLAIAVFFTSCKQNQTEVSKTTKPEAKDTVSPYGPSEMVRNVKQARNGNILIAASTDGVFRYDGNYFTNFTSKLGKRIFWDVLEDRRGNLWLATKDTGLYYYNGKSFRHFTTKDGLVNNRVMCIYEDRSGVVWFGTGGGISRYDGKSFRNFTTAQGLSNNDITTITQDKTGKFWIGTRGDACYFDGKTFTVFKNGDGNPFYNVWSIIEDRKGTIWFGGNIIDDRKGDTLFVSPGLWRFDGKTYTKVSPKGASKIIEDKKGNMWTTGAVNANGVGDWALLRYDQKSLGDKNPTATQITAAKWMLCGILEASDGSIWYGSLNGVYRYDAKAVTDFRSPSLPGTARTNCFYCSRPYNQAYRKSLRPAI